MKVDKYAYYIQIIISVIMGAVHNKSQIYCLELTLMVLVDF